MKPAVLVAGGAGYIGSHVAKTLAEAGFMPVVLDDMSGGTHDFVRFGPLVEACVSDVAAVAAAVHRYGITAVIDLAGSIEVAASVRDPISYYDNNFSRKLPFLKVLLESGVKAYVFSSTAAVYGEPNVVPIPESHALNPTSPYGQSKLMTEILLRDVARAHGLRYTALRYFNAAGASPEGELGENHEPETHLIPLACMASLGLGKPLSIFGNDYPTPDGTAIRDYIHVLDLADAHVLALKAMLGGAPSATYNLGNGVGTSVAEILQAFRTLGHPVPHSFKGRRAGDPSRLVADSSAIREALGWLPRHSGVETIIQSAYEWHAMMGATNEVIPA